MVNSLINTLLFKPPECEAYHLKHHVLYLETSRSERIAATFLKRRGAHVTILFSHGNAEDLNTSYRWMKRIARDLNVNVMSYDYSGYGLSSGTPSEANCYADIQAAFRYLVEERKIQPHQIVLYGRSLGSGPSCFLAKRSAKEGNGVAGLILHSPFTSVYRVVLDFGFTMVGDQFPNIDRIQKVQCPVIVVHGEQDEVVPFDHGKALYEAIPSKFRAEPFWVPEMGHNNYDPETGQELMRRLNQYLDYHILSRRLWLLPEPRNKKDKHKTDPRVSLSPTTVQVTESEW